MMCACRQHPLITPWLWCLHMHLHSLGSGLKHTPLDSGGVEKGSGICIFIKSLEDCNVFQDEEPVFCLLGSSMTSFLLGKVGKEVWRWHTRWVLQGWAIGQGLSSCRGGAKIREEGKITQAHQAEKKLLNLMLAPVRSWLQARNPVGSWEAKPRVQVRGQGHSEGQVVSSVCQ